MNVLMVMVLTNVELTYDRISNIGLFGWMNLESDRLPVEIAMVLLCNVIGLVGYVRAMQYLAIATAALMEPVAAELMACVLCVGVLLGLDRQCSRICRNSGGSNSNRNGRKTRGEDGSLLN